jgi:hypothetical protein
MSLSNVYFSSYCDEENIEKEFDGNLRYFLTIPYRNRENGAHAAVILKNPSNAGKRDNSYRLVSDDTVYHVLDYFYKIKREDQYVFSKVTILNLYPHIGGTVNGQNIQNLDYDDEEVIIVLNKNDCTIRNIISDPTNEVCVFAGWGAPPSKFTANDKEKYKERIREVLERIEFTIYRVGKLVEEGIYPGHGKNWYDYKEIYEYSEEEISSM